MPLSIPAGIRTFIVRRLRTRPWPEHSKHGLGMTSPKPWQAAHGREVMTWPRKLRWTIWTSPRPPQASQVRLLEPGWAPSPAHVPHRSAVSIVSSFVPPNTASSRST